MTALRTYDSSSWPSLAETGPAWVMRTSPEDGAVFVLRDTPVLLRLSHAVDPTSVAASAVRVLDAEGEVPAGLRWTALGHVVVWEATRLLMPGVEHVVIARGLRDRRGREVAEHWSRFVPCGLSGEDLRSP